MSNRRRPFRPGLTDTLEGRVVPSQLSAAPRAAAPALIAAQAAPVAPLPNIQVSPSTHVVSLSGSISVPVLIRRNTVSRIDHWSLLLLARPGSTQQEYQALLNDVPHVSGAITSGLTVPLNAGQWGNLNIFTPKGWIYASLSGPTTKDNVHSGNQPVPTILSYQIWQGTGAYNEAKGGGAIVVALAGPTGAPISTIPPRANEPGTLTLTFYPNPPATSP